MEPLIVAMVLASAALHPLRDVIIKGRAHAESAYLSVILVWITAAVTHGLIIGADFSVPLHVWPLIAVSALGLVAYYVGVAVTIQRGDLSVYYPIVRSSPAFIILCGVLFLGQRYSALLLAGMALTVIGAFFLQYRRGTGLFHQPLVLGAALAAMAGSGLAVVVDSVAMQTIPPVTLIACGYPFVALACGVYFMLRRRAGASLVTHLLAGWRGMPLRYLGAGLTSYLSYYLILASFQHGGNVAAVSSLRQVAIPISVLISGVYLREESFGRRLFWSLVLAAGLILIIFAR